MDPFERFFPPMILDHLIATTPHEDLRRILGWIVLNPVHGSLAAADNVLALGIEVRTGEFDAVRERVEQGLAALAPAERKGKAGKHLALRALTEKLRDLGYGGLVLHGPDQSRVLAEGEPKVHVIREPANGQKSVAYCPLLPRRRVSFRAL